MDVGRRGLFKLFLGGAGVFAAEQALAVVEKPKPEIVVKEVIKEVPVGQGGGTLRVGSGTRLVDCTLDGVMVKVEGVVRDVEITGCRFNGPWKELS